MKILQLCNKPPYPSVDGGTIGMNSVTQGLLSQGCEVKVLSAYSYKHPVLHSAMTDEYKKQTDFESVFFDLRIKPLQSLCCLLSGESYHIKRFINKTFEKKLIAILKKSDFDIIHIESLFLTPYVKIIRKYSNAKIVLRSHNVEHLIWKQIASHTKNPFKRWYLKHLSLSLRNYELEHLTHYDGVVCAAENDASFFKENGLKKPLTAIPFVITNPKAAENIPIEPNSLFHLGSMDWMPNDEGIGWFLNDVWPLITKKMPQVKLYLAGRKMPKKYLDYSHTYPNITISGEIDNAIDFMASKQLNIVPLLSGSGFRIKIIEAMSLKKTVITTSAGAEGINYQEGVHLLIADTPEAFVSQIEKCINDVSLTERIGENAFQLISDEYRIEKLTEKLTAFYKAL